MTAINEITHIASNPKYKSHHSKIPDNIDDMDSKKTGGGDGGDLTMWQQSVENRLGQLHMDIKDLRGDLKDGFNGSRTEFNGLRAEFNGLRADLNTFRYWAIGIYLSGMGVMLTVMAKGFGWL